MCDRDAGRRFASDECRKRDERPGWPRGPSRPRKRGSLTCAGEGEEIASFCRRVCGAVSLRCSRFGFVGMRFSGGRSKADTSPEPAPSLA